MCTSPVISGCLYTNEHTRESALSRTSCMRYSTPMGKKLGRSEFERNGVFPFGGFGIARAWEKLRMIYRTEQDPEGTVVLNAPADRYEHGGIESVDDHTIN